jgi:hypothetical protein
MAPQRKNTDGRLEFEWVQFVLEGASVLWFFWKLNCSWLKQCGGHTVWLRGGKEKSDSQPSLFSLLFIFSVLFGCYWEEICVAKFTTNS